MVHLRFTLTSTRKHYLLINSVNTNLQNLIKENTRLLRPVGLGHGLGLDHRTSKMYLENKDKKEQNLKLYHTYCLSKPMDTDVQVN